MGVGAFAEPLVVVTLLFGGTWINRNRFPGYSVLKNSSTSSSSLQWASLDVEQAPRKRSDDDYRSGSRSDGSLSPPSSDRAASWSDSATVTGADDESRRRLRKFRFLRYQRFVATPNTRVFKDRLLSRLLERFPFLVEAWYWALIYWVYQLGRAFTALTLVESSVDVARKHALQLVHLEQRLHIFFEVPFQQWFIQHPLMMKWINRTYSYVHIPGSILFLVVLYYITTTRRRRDVAGPDSRRADASSASPALYETRRRTMALCNLLAFIVFTLWPCMPPRLLSDPNYKGPQGSEAKSFGFVDTVHSGAGESSVWTTNRFCNQYAAMPSLHFGYSLLIGLTIATLPLNGARAYSRKRLAVVAIGLCYPAIILTAIVATANHFIVDAIAGAMVCGIAWHMNGVLLNLLIIEDYFLALVRIHKPVNWTDPDTTPEQWPLSTL